MSFERVLNEMQENSLLRNLREFTSFQSNRVIFEGREIINFSSNDYLGLCNRQEVKDHFCESIKKWGVGSGSSRLISGTQSPHINLENKLADLKGTESCLSFSSGYASSVGVLSGLFAKEDVLILDKLVHASLVDGARLSGAKIRVFKHNDVSSLEKKINWASEVLKNNEQNDDLNSGKKSKSKGKICVIIESVYSMDGDSSPLKEICDLKNKYEFMLLVDEAHSFGIYGSDNERSSCSGMTHKLGLSHKVDLQMGTFSKAVGMSGGFICARREIIKFLINRSRSFIYSTAPSASLCDSILFCIKLLESKIGEELRQKLYDNIEFTREVLHDYIINEDDFLSPIIPIHIGGEDDCLKISNYLIKKNIFMPAIRYPTVPKGKSRLRLSLSSMHTKKDILELRDVLELLKKDKILNV